MIIFDKAKKEEIQNINNLIVSSEAYWGHNEAFLKEFIQMYQITETFLDESISYVMKYNYKIMAYFGLIKEKKYFSLEYFFISPEFIGKGFGKKLWKFMIGVCKILNIFEFTIVSTPEAEKFYLKMGAVKIGMTPSILNKKNTLPKLKYNIK